MGLARSKHAAAAPATEEEQRGAHWKRIVLVGASGTGKSHFLSVVCGDGMPNDETRHSTHGQYKETLKHRGVQLDFVELGWPALRADCCTWWQHDADAVMWFIDERDSRSRIQHVRSHLLGFLESHAGIRGLCIILNKRTPYAGAGATQNVTWSTLPSMCDVEALQGLFARRIYLSELSYEDEHTPLLFLDWLASDGD